MSSELGVFHWYCKPRYTPNTVKNQKVLSKKVGYFTWVQIYPPFFLSSCVLYCLICDEKDKSQCNTYLCNLVHSIVIIAIVSLQWSVSMWIYLYANSFRTAPFIWLRYGSLKDLCPLHKKENVSKIGTWNSYSTMIIMILFLSLCRKIVNTSVVSHTEHDIFISSLGFVKHVPLVYEL